MNIMMMHTRGKELHPGLIQESFPSPLIISSVFYFTSMRGAQGEETRDS